MGFKIDTDAPRDAARDQCAEKQACETAPRNRPPTALLLRQRAEMLRHEAFCLEELARHLPLSIEDSPAAQRAIEDFLRATLRR